MLDSFNVVCFDQSLYKACCSCGSPVRDSLLFQAKNLSVTMAFQVVKVVMSWLFPCYLNSTARYPAVVSGTASPLINSLQFVLTNLCTELVVLMGLLRGNWYILCQ